MEERKHDRTDESVKKKEETKGLFEALAALVPPPSDLLESLPAKWPAPPPCPPLPVPSTIMPPTAVKAAMAALAVPVAGPFATIEGIPDPVRWPCRWRAEAPSLEPAVAGRLSDWLSECTAVLKRLDVALSASSSPTSLSSLPPVIALLDCMPWTTDECAELAGRVCDAVLSRSSPVEDLLPWCRTQLRSTTQPAGGHPPPFTVPYVVAWVVQAIKFPNVTADVMGHALPIVMQLMDDLDAGCEWLGLMGLAHLLRHASPTIVRSHAVIVRDLVDRSFASSDPAVLQLAAHTSIAATAVLRAPQTPDGEDEEEPFHTAYHQLVRTFMLKPDPVLRCCLFYSLTRVTMTIGIGMCRHLRHCLEECHAAVTLDPNPAVACAALTLVQACVVVCWPRAKEPANADVIERLANHVADHPDQYGSLTAVEPVVASAAQVLGLLDRLKGITADK